MTGSSTRLGCGPPIWFQQAPDSRSSGFPQHEKTASSARGALLSLGATRREARGGSLNGRPWSARVWLIAAHRRAYRVEPRARIAWTDDQGTQRFCVCVA